MKEKEEVTNDTKLQNESPTPSTSDEQGEEQSADMELAQDEEEQITENDADRLARELEEAKDKHLRLYSEFENFRRRTAKERLELIGTANADLISALLPVIDDFERAKKVAEGDEELSAQQEGMKLVYQKLIRELKQRGLKPMDDLIGKSFDAEVHEAISQIPAPKKKLKNCIVDVVEKGYYLNDKVIRYAKVVIGT